MPRTDMMIPTPVPRLPGPPPGGAMPSGVLRPAVAIAPARSRKRLANDPINWWLLGLTAVYLAWSYFFIASSIWARLVLLIYLTWRMKPDIIVPYLLAGLQLRLNVATAASDELHVGTSDISEGLTGFESYAFAIPPLMFTVRTAIAFFSARTDRRFFPSVVYLIWALGFVLVLVGAFVNFRGGRGWTGALRMYSLIGAVFYGLLLPRLKPAELDRLANGVIVVAVGVFTASLLGVFGSRLAFVLGPAAATWGVLGAASLSRSAPVGVATLFTTGIVCLYRSTFMAFGGWMWGAIAGVLLWSRPRAEIGKTMRMRTYVAATVVFTLFLFVIGIQRQVADKSGHDGTFLGRIEWKLYADRGPIWKGCLQIIMEEPSILPTPERPFLIRWFGSEDVLWANGPHNLILELLNQLGWVAGPIALLVCAYTVTACSRVLARDSCRGALTLAACAIAAIAVGGLTLPYVAQERQGEFVWLAAGLAIGSSGVNHLEARRAGPRAA
jgi:hypothetical protein